MDGPAHEERELKFLVDADFDLGAAGALGPGLTIEPAGTKRQHATYYDTADHRLTRAGASLRFRDDDGWTVKLPGTADVALVRSELHVDGGPGDPPDAARDLVAALARRSPLQFAAHVDTERRRFWLRDDDGDAVAEISDDDVSTRNADRTTKEFRELEVEFVESASEQLVDAVARHLHDAGAGEPQHLSKVARALGPRALDAPDLVPPADLDFASTPTDVLRAALSRSTARLLAHDPGVRLGGDDEDVHQARVATRRMRSDLRTFRRALDTGWDESLREDLEWLGDLLGAVRDADVLLARLQGRVDDLPDTDHAAGDRLLDVLRAERATARDELLAGMRSDRYLDLIERLLAASRAVPVSADGADFELELGDLAAKPWKKLRRAVHDLDDDPPDPALHAVRIRAKRARYAAEAVASALGKEAKQFAVAVADLQDLLGEHQDAVVAGRWLREHVPAGDGGAAFVAGQLVLVEADAADRSRDEWPAAWAAAKHPKLRRWM
ncbi:MAG TPA: CYTH and CHAD domain-containing protein [Acidimicrobiia bacterium]|nr:CYTH and CHAD domain-containing protein [Acidimicrobiia bacterium]